MRAVEVVRAGTLSTVQDLGRPGYAHLGVPRSGAVDVPALRLANRLVGNDEAAAGIEVTLSGCTLRPQVALTIAVTGAPAEVRVDRRGRDHGLPVTVPAGGLVELGPATAGVRTYVGLAGGIAVPPVLGSRSYDTLSGLGPAPLRDGDVLPLGSPVDVPAGVDTPVVPAPEPALALRIALGPRDDWFTADALEALLTASYTISPTSNRVGARLTGVALARAVERELPSEGLVLGAVQVPADGQPLIFLADHPTTGGYPVVGVLHPDEVPVVAQARPGTAVRFVRWT